MNVDLILTTYTTRNCLLQWNFHCYKRNQPKYNLIIARKRHCWVLALQSHEWIVQGFRWFGKCLDILWRLWWFRQCKMPSHCDNCDNFGNGNCLHILWLNKSSLTRIYYNDIPKGTANTFIRIVALVYSVAFLSWVFEDKRSWKEEGRRGMRKKKKIT